MYSPLMHFVPDDTQMTSASFTSVPVQKEYEWNMSFISPLFGDFSKREEKIGHVWEVEAN